MTVLGSWTSGSSRPCRTAWRPRPWSPCSTVIAPSRATSCSPHDGVIVQFAGDAIEAFWNAPMDQPDHARRACQAALDMSLALGAIRPRSSRRAAGITWTSASASIRGGWWWATSARAAVSEYAVVGDPVNVAARLEGLTKLYGVRVVAGDDTRAAAGEAFAWRFLDRVAVKGRPAPLNVWQVVERAERIDAGMREQLARYEEGVELYRSRRSR